MKISGYHNCYPIFLSITKNNPRNWQRKAYPINIFRDKITTVEYQNYQKLFCQRALLVNHYLTTPHFSEYKASIIKTLLADSHYQNKFSELIIRLIDNYIQVTLIHKINYY